MSSSTQKQVTKSNLKTNKVQKVYELRYQSIKNYGEIVYLLQQINSRLELINTSLIPKLNESLRLCERLITTIYTLFKSTVFTVDQLSKNQMRDREQTFGTGNRRDTEINNARGNYEHLSNTIMRSSPPIQNTRDLDTAKPKEANDLPWFTSLYETNRPKLI